MGLEFAQNVGSVGGAEADEFRHKELETTVKMCQTKIERLGSAPWSICSVQGP